ncbi:S8 family serine peptidase [bacterium]|nr:S8 family serine peptidase [bacterium]
MISPARLLLAASLVLCAGNALAFSLVDMTPHYLDFETKPNEDVFLVFNQSINPATATPGNVRLLNPNGTAVSASIAVITTNVANDTVVINPVGNLMFGRRYRVSITANLKDAGGGAFDDKFPAGLNWFVPNVPLDLARPVFDPQHILSIFTNSNVLLGFNPLDPESTDPAEPWTIPGINATGAWKVHTGRPEIMIADIDNGLSSFHSPEMHDRFFINMGELPPPLDGATPCAYDCNGDGRFSSMDYLNDPRVDHSGRSYVDPQDLIDAFSNGLDEDGNGFVDDISGWDFLRNVNTPLGVSQFPEGTHSGLVASAAAAPGGNGVGDKPGVCPDCTVMVVRVTDAVLGDADAMAAGARYALDMGASVIMVPLGAVDYSHEAMGVFREAHDAGVLSIAASGDEWGYHHIYPAASDDVMSVHAVLPIPPIELAPDISLGIFGFTESYCTNWGTHIDITVSTGACSSEAVGNGAGLAGLIYSYALQRGIGISAEEVRQIMMMTADDVASHCLTLTPGGCKEGWDNHWGYGRVNAERALFALGVPDLGIPERIPPAVRVTSPRYWETIDPTRDPLVEVVGEISARGRTFDWEIAIALGGEPDEDEFTAVAQGTSDALDGLIDAFDITSVYPLDSLRAIANGPFDKSFHLRVRAWYAEGTDVVMGETRKTIAFNIDDDPDTGWMPGMPLDIGRAGEGAPLLYDIDGDADGKLEIVVATSSGTIEAYKIGANGAFAMMSGFPVELPPVDGVNQGSSGAPAIGDLFRDGRPIVVVATTAGRVYAVWPDGTNHPGGPFVPGFPVEADEPDNDTPLTFAHGNRFVASPILADMDGDGLLDIVAGAYDQKVYVWSPLDTEPDGEADRLPGWPVLVRSAPGLVPPDRVCSSAIPASILGTPAVGILDPTSDDTGLSDFPSVVVGTTEVCNDGGEITSRLYGIWHDGNDHAGGPFVPGFPVALTDPIGDEIPIPPMTTGATSTPSVYVKDGKAFVGVGCFGFPPLMVEWEDGVAIERTALTGLNIADSASASWGKMRPDDEDPWFFMPTAGLANITDGQFALLSFNLAGWEFGRWGNARMRHKLDDVQFLQSPVIADLDGDGMQEAISASLGYLVRAWNADGETPAGWPKYTQNGHLSSVSVADVDADGKSELVAHTLEGRLFAWETVGDACNGEDELAAEWRTFHHDERNTGFYGVDTLPPATPKDMKVYFDDEDVGKYIVEVTAPGDDHFCGVAMTYDVRYITAPPAGDPIEAFEHAAPIGSPVPSRGGQRIDFDADAPGGVYAFAMRAQDDEGNLGLPTPWILPEDRPADDDDADDDDATDDDADDDDDAGDDDDGDIIPPADDDDDTDDGATRPDHQRPDDEVFGDDDDDDGCGCGC